MRSTADRVHPWAGTISVRPVPAAGSFPCYEHGFQRYDPGVTGGDRIRIARRAAGLSQQLLADRSGLSRQAIGAIEAGRHRPGIDAALALAVALGSSVEALFASAPTRSLGVLGDDPPADGTLVLVRSVGGRTVHAPAGRGAIGQEAWPLADGVWTAGTAETVDDHDPQGLVVVGCDPALSLAAAQLPAVGPRRLTVLTGSTAVALEALAGGRAHGALVHGPAGALAEPPPGTLRLHLARWRVGLATRAARPAGLTALTGAHTAVVQREAGASSQQALLRAVRAAGAPPPAGPVAGGHLAVARRVAEGAHAGVTFEPAAAYRGLGFLALEEHVVQVWIAPAHRTHPGVAALADVLASATFTRRLAAIGGYDLAGCGRTLEERPC